MGKLEIFPWKIILSPDQLTKKVLLYMQTSYQKSLWNKSRVNVDHIYTYKNLYENKVLPAPSLNVFVKIEDYYLTEVSVGTLKCRTIKQ